MSEHGRSNILRSSPRKRIGAKLMIACIDMPVVPHQHLDPIFLGKTGHGSRSMLPDSPYKIVCHSRVQRSVSPACQDANVKAHLLGSWVPLARRLRGDERRERMCQNEATGEKSNNTSRV